MVLYFNLSLAKGIQIVIFYSIIIFKFLVWRRGISMMMEINASLN